MTRAEILAEAKRCVCGAREQDYGSPEDNFGTIAALWNVYLGAAGRQELTPIKAKDVAIMMALLKVARIAGGNGTKADSYVDLAGYAACAGEICTGCAAGGKEAQP